MRRPQDEGLEHAHEDVVARIEVLHQALEAGQAARGRFAFGVERGAQAGQQRAGELFALHADQHFGEQAEFVRGLLHGGDGHAHLAVVAVEKPAVDEQGDQEEIEQQGIDLGREADQARRRAGSASTGR